MLIQSIQNDYLDIARVRLGICKDDFRLISDGMSFLQAIDEEQICIQLKDEMDCFCDF